MLALKESELMELGIVMPYGITYLPILRKQKKCVICLNVLKKKISVWGGFEIVINLHTPGWGEQVTPH